MMLKKRYLLLAMCLMVFALNASAQKKRDTIFLMREFGTDGDTDWYHTIFIDTSRTSHYRRLLADFSVDRSPGGRFRTSLAYLRKQGLPLTRRKIGGIPLRWIPVHLYRNKYYLYKPNDFHGYYRAWFTDTAFIDNGGEGATVSRITGFKRTDARNSSVKLQGMGYAERELSIHIIDSKRGIAVFEDREGNWVDYYLMIDAARSRGLPVIVNHSTRPEKKEFGFDKPDFQKLIGSR